MDFQFVTHYAVIYAKLIFGDVNFSGFVAAVPVVGNKWLWGAIFVVRYGAESVFGKFIFSI